MAVLSDRSSVLDWQAAESAARLRGWKLLSFEIQDAADLEGFFRAATGARAGALLVSAAGILFPHARRFAQLCAKYRLPAVYELREYVDAGGLLSYGPEVNDMWRRASVFVDKILKGAKPADLPVEQPVKFELVINRRTAEALRLTISESVLSRADEVIR